MRVKLRANMGREYLHHILPKEYPDDLCEHCGVTESLEHFLYQCSAYEEQRSASGLDKSVTNENIINFVIQTERPF